MKSSDREQAFKSQATFQGQAIIHYDNHITDTSSQKPQTY